MKAKKPHLKVKINNHTKEFGNYDDRTGVLEINLKKHKGDKEELRDTVEHELYHRQHPKATEKATYKKSKEESHSKEAKKILKTLHKKAYSA